MFSALPRKYQILVRVSLSVAWVFVALGGVGTVFFSPLTIASEMGLRVMYALGGMSVIAAMSAMFGVAAGYYRVEWSAAWFAAAGFSAYAITLWWLVFTGETTRLTQASIVSAAIMFMVTRALFCAAHAAKLRALHSGETSPTHVPY